MIFALNTLKHLSWAWLLSIAYLSLTPQTGLPISFNHIDKILHFGSYSLATLLALLAYPDIKKFHLLTTLFIYSFLIEIGQLFIENRFFELYDLLANFTGILIAAYMVNTLPLSNFNKINKPT